MLLIQFFRIILLLLMKLLRI